MSGRSNARVRHAARALVCAGILVFALVGPAIASAAGVLAFSYSRSGWCDVYTVRPDGTRVKPLSLDGLSGRPSWSPDGTRMAFLRAKARPNYANAREIRTMRSDGSNDRLLREWERAPTAIEWSPKARYLAVADYDATSDRTRITQLDVRTGATRVLYSRTSVGRVRDIAYSPSGTQLLFVVNEGRTFRSYLLNVSSGSVRAAAVRNSHSVAWSRSTGEMAFNSKDADNRSLVRVLPPGGSLSEVLNVGYVGGMSWSPDASMLVVDAEWASCPVQQWPCTNSGLFTMTSTGAAVTRIFTDTRMQYPPWAAENPEWQPTRTRQAPSISASVPSTCAYGGPAKMTFTLKNAAGHAIAGRTVVVQSSSDARSWETVTSRTTDSRGRVTATGAPKTLRYYRAFFAGDSTYGQVTGAIHSVRPKASLTRPDMPSSPAKGAFFTASGYLKPQGASGSMPVSIYCYHKESGDWVLRRISSAKLSDYSSYSRYKATISLQYSGSWRARAQFEGDARNAATKSSWRYFSVR